MAVTVHAGPALMEASEDGKTCAMNFAVRSRFATSMSLVLARQPSGEASSSLEGTSCLNMCPYRCCRAVESLGFAVLL